MKPLTLVRVALGALAFAAATKPAAADFLNSRQFEAYPAPGDDGLQTATGAFFAAGHPACSFTLGAWLYTRPRHDVGYGDPVFAALHDPASLISGADRPAAPGQSGVAPTPGAGGGGASGGGGGGGSRSQGPSTTPLTATSLPGLNSFVSDAPGVFVLDGPASGGLGFIGQPDGTPVFGPAAEGEAAITQATPEPSTWALTATGLALTAAGCARALRPCRVRP